MNNAYKWTRSNKRGAAINKNRNIFTATAATTTTTIPSKSHPNLKFVPTNEQQYELMRQQEYIFINSYSMNSADVRKNK